MATSRQELLRAHEAMDGTFPRSTLADADEVVCDLARILNTGLDRETLGILVSLLEQGVSPEGLAEVIKELRKEAAQSPPTVTPAQVPAPKLAQAQPKN